MAIRPTCTSLLVALLPLCVKAEIPCPVMPADPSTITRDVKADIDVQVGKLGPIKASELAAKADVAAKAVFGNYPNIDKLVAIHTMAATYCAMLRDDRAISATEKADRWNAFQLKVLSLYVINQSPENASSSTPERRAHSAPPKEKMPSADAHEISSPAADPEWGAITTSTSYFTVGQLELLTNGNEDVGAVSGKINDPSGTGVLFRGHIHQSSGTGVVGIGIYDSVAANGGSPLYFEMPVVQVGSTPSKNGAEVYLQTGSTVFRFNGDFKDSMWTGTFEYEDTRSGKRTPLGDFTIVACSILDCS